MSRHALPPSEKRSRTVQVRVTDADHERLERVALAAGFERLSDYLYNACRKALHEWESSSKVIGKR